MLTYKTIHHHIRFVCIRGLPVNYLPSCTLRSCSVRSLLTHYWEESLGRSCRQLLFSASAWLGLLSLSCKRLGDGLLGERKKQRKFPPWNKGTPQMKDGRRDEELVSKTSRVNLCNDHSLKSNCSDWHLLLIAGILDRVILWLFAHLGHLLHPWARSSPGPILQTVATPQTATPPHSPGPFGTLVQCWPGVLKLLEGL